MSSKNEVVEVSVSNVKITRDGLKKINRKRKAVIRIRALELRMSGMPVASISRELRVSEPTIYRWTW